MDADAEHAVHVTHFINPHLFWYRKINETDDDDICLLAELEGRLRDIYKNKPLMETRCRPTVGDKVAVHFVAWNRLIRAEVVQTAEFKQEEFIVWCTDYGFPLLTKKEYVRRLPEQLQIPVDVVHCGGLSNIQPAEVEYDHVESNLIMVQQDQWLQKSCEMVEKLLADAASVLFMEKFRTHDDHLWGDLVIVNHKGRRLNVRNYLQDAKYAMKVGLEFRQACLKYKTTNIAPWLTNNRKTNVKYNSIKGNIVEHSQQMNTAKIDEFAKRKVEDWCARNERQKECKISDLLLESGAESNHDESIDDITFDDSASAVHYKKKEKEQKSKSKNNRRQGQGKQAMTHENLEIEEQVNYIGKAGALTKLKQEKYASKGNLPPKALLQAFDIEPDMVSPSSAEPQLHDAATAVSSNSSSNSVSARMQKLAELRVKHARTNVVSQPQNKSSSDSSASGSGKISLRMQKMAELRKKCAQNGKEHSKEASSSAADLPKHLTEMKITQKHQNPSPSDFNTTTVSISSSAGGGSVSSRMQKIIELRKKSARRDEEMQSKEGDDSKGAIPKGSNNAKIKKNLTDSIISVESHSTINPDISYQQLEQSYTCTTGNDSNLDKSQESKSELSVKNARAKHLSALRSKLNQPLTTPNSCETNTTSASKTTDSTLAMTSTKYKENLKKIKEQNHKKGDHNDKIDIFSFKLKPKLATPDTQSSSPKEIPKLPPMKISKDTEEKSQAAYDGLTLVPAGFDITRLQSYRDEKNHWHRKKSTRSDHIPHDISSCEEMLLTSHDQSSSSSDFLQTTPNHTHSASTLANRLKRPSLLLDNETTNLFSDVAEHDANILDLSVPSACNSSVVKPLQFSNNRASEDPFNIRYDGALPNQISTSTTSSTISNKNHGSQNRKQRRELKSPTSQISKIDEILKQHSLENELGNKNILDLKRLSTTSQKLRHPKDGREEGNATTTSGSDTGTSNTRVLVHKPSIDMIINSPDKFCNEKHLKNVSNYTTLMEVKHVDHLPVVDGEIKMKTKFIDHLVLAHSSIPLSPIENVVEASFLPEIHEEMRNMRINKVYRIQVYSWTHLLRGNSLFVVNPSRTGKTLSYLPALCSLVCYRSGTLKPSYGPVALVLVASSRHVESVNGYSRRLMSGLKANAPSCVPSYGMRNFIDTKVQLLNGCGILITTPSSLLRLLKDNETEPLFDWLRLQHIVIDDMDIMLSRSHEDFESAVSIVFKMAKKSAYKTLQPQLIVTSRDWDCVMIRLIRKSNQPLLLIGDFLEAAVYGRATLSVKLKSSEEKNDTIHRFLEKQTQYLQGDLAYKRLMIMCNGDEDVEKVMQFLTECGYPCLAYYNRSTDNERTSVDEWKNKVSSQILICTDARFPELQIQNVQNLVHYSMPTSWTQFTTRFSALAQTYGNFVCKKFEDPIVARKVPSENSPHSMILLDEENSLQLPRLVDFMRKHDQIVHPDILAVSKRVFVMREESRIFNGSLLCPQLMEFGECDEARCDNRHELTRYDVIGENDDIPSAGDMRIHILKVFSPTHYTARLLQHKAANTKNWVEVRRSREALAFTMQLDVHYRNENNLSLHWPPKTNDICIYKYADNYRRSKILDVPPLLGKNTNVVQSKLKVKLKLIDDGIIISDIKCSEIFVCDDKFKDFPAQAVDIRLMFVVPFDNERTWDSKTTKQVQKWIMDDIKTNHIVHVSINFSLANTVWVKNVIVMEELATLGTYRQYVNLKKSLIQKNFAVVYNGERKHVRDIAEEYGLLKSSEQIKHQEVTDSSMEDYQSCQNESVDLIKFSSSNGDDASPNSSMQSAKNDVPSDSVKSAEYKELQAVKDTEQATKSKYISGTTLKSNIAEEENWDNMSSDGKEKGNEIFVPLKKVLPTADSAPLFSTPQTKESWSQLFLNDVTMVEIGDEGENGNWENIFLQIIDKKHMQKFDDLVELVNKHVNQLKENKEGQKRVYEFDPLHNCIVKYNNIYLRAKVHGVFGENVKERLYRFFLCDYGCFANVKSSELYNDCFYETTNEIVHFVPYQSVHCTLVGIQWNRFAKRYQVTKEYLYACAVEERNDEEKKVLCLCNLPIRSYKILLFECEKEGVFSSAEMFNKTLIDVGITTTDEATKHYLDYKLDTAVHSLQNAERELVVEEVNRESSSEDEVYTFEQLLTCIQKSQELDDIDNTLLEDTTNVLKDIKVPEKDVNILEEQNSVDKQETENQRDRRAEASVNNKYTVTRNDREIDDDDEGHCTTDSENKKSSSSIPSSNSTLDATEPLLPLKALNKRPLTTWYETEWIIFLSIHAPDIKDYVLEVKPRKVLFVTEIQNDDYILHLNLLGSVNPESVSHEIKGLNVVVRLVKNIFGKWPRLLQEPTKYSWLKYNYSCFDSSELDCIAPQQRLQAVLENSPNINEANLHNEFDSDDSERDKFETYNRIENNDDFYDPFS